ncbi:hypothetical protein SCUP515_05691 [Seiridium cupressi]
MILAPAANAHWKDFLVPAAYTDVNKLIRQEPRPDVSLSVLHYPARSDGHLSSNDGGDHDDAKYEAANPSNTEVVNGSRTREKYDFHVQADPSGIPKRSSSKTSAERASPKNHISYIVHRNLEHILSVCSVPLKAPRMGMDEEITEGKILPVALTCGDMAFHRISASSSFFAFQFLLDVAQRLKHPELNGSLYAEWLLKRIASVCKGHLRWIATNLEKSESGYFVANYWVTGVIFSQKSPSWRPNDSLTDNPFQIVKAGNHVEVFPEDKDEAIAAVRSIYLPWLNNLERQDKRNRFAWPHAQESEINVFRLEDHLWIWKALKTIDDLGLWANPSQHQGRHQAKSDELASEALEHDENIKRWARTYGFRKVQREMLRRFTTESDVSRKRMLAVTRSPRETRFLFHARDTALFYEHGTFLLQDTSFRQVWENTIEAQKHHDENQETRWDNALRYALAVVMGTSGYAINKEKSPTQLIQSSLNVLLRSSSHNGLFAGQLDETTKEPVLFYREEDRDFYFHTSFEIPYILLTRDAIINERYSTKSSKEPRAEIQSEIPHDDIAELSERLTAQPKRQAVALELEGSGIPQLENIAATQGKVINKMTQAAQQNQTMKKIMPFNRFIDSSSIVEISEEWLYNYPSFLANDKTLSREEVREQLARFLIESRGIRSITRLIVQDGDLAANIIANDEELRNRLCRDLASTEAQICLDILADPVNRQIREKLNDVLNKTLPHGISPAARSFLATGIMPEHMDILTRRASNASSIVSSASLVVTDLRTYMRRFLGDADVAEVMETILFEAKYELDHCIRNYQSIREGIEWLLTGEVETVSRLFLRNKALYDKVPLSYERRDSFPGPVVLRAAKRYLDQVYEQDPERNGGMWTFRNTTYSVAVADTKKKRTQGKRSKTDTDSSLSSETNLELWEKYLNVPRTAKTAKKRFIHLPWADTETALICFLGSPEVERPSISIFFDRHQVYELYFFDDTTMSLNTWETELHLSFYQLVQDDAPFVGDGIPNARKDVLPGGKGSHITKASVGFRFSGDFTDRYWTCHFIEYVPAENFSADLANQLNSQDRAWRQRKVLELILFDRIIAILVSSTKEIVEKIKHELGVRHGAFSFVNLQSDDYFSSSDHWQESQQTLQAIEDHLEHVIAVVNKWETREKDRGIEKPRWTHNDEWKYRGDLKKLLASNTSKIRDMYSLHNEIKTLKEFLMSRQDQIRNDLSLRGAENIRFFTYVTVVFLPLGFAASIFSMSENPDGQLIGSMAGTAAVALVLTVIALINAETLGDIAGTISRTIAYHTDIRMARSHFLQRYRMARHEAHTFTGEHKQAVGGPTQINASGPETLQIGRMPRTQGTRQRGHPKNKNSWHLWFWVIYILIEVPVNRTALAYAALKGELSPAAVLNVILGILVLPWCILVWIFQLILLNLIDFIRLLKHLVVSPFSRPSPPVDPFQGNAALLLRPNTKMRPFLKLDISRGRKDGNSLRKTEQPALQEQRLKARGVNSSGTPEVSDGPELKIWRTWSWHMYVTFSRTALCPWCSFLKKGQFPVAYLSKQNNLENLNTMAYAAPTIMDYPPPPSSGRPRQDNLAAAMAGMSISPGPVQSPGQRYSSPDGYAPTYQPAQYRAATAPPVSAQHVQTYTQSHRPSPEYNQTTILGSQPPPVPDASTRPGYQTQSPLPGQAITPQPQYIPAAYQPAQNSYMQSQVPTSPILPTQANSPGVPAHYAPPPYRHSQQGSPQPVQGQRPISLQAKPQSSKPSQPPRPGAQYSQSTQNHHLNPVPHFAGQLAQHTPHHQQQQSHARPISYAGPPQVSHVSQGQAAYQQPERKGRGFFDKMSSTQKLGASLVSGLAPTVLSHQGKEKIGKWGKGKIDSFAGAMGYAPAAAASPPPIGKPQGNPGPIPTGVVDTRPVMYARPGALGAIPVRHVHPGAGRGGGPPPVAPAVLVGTGAGGILGASLAGRPGDNQFASGTVSAVNGGVAYYQPTAETSYTDVSSVDSAALDSNTVHMDSAVTYDQVTVADTSYTTLPSTDVAAANSNTSGLDSTVTYEQTTTVDMSVSNANSSGLDSTNSYSADYSGYQGPGDGAMHADTTIYSDAIGSGSGYTEPTATYTDTYSETAYAEPSYAADSGYTEYASETTYVSETEVYAAAGEFAEAATSDGGGGGSWLDSLGLGSGSWTDMSNWGGSVDSGDAALALI